MPQKVEALVPRDRLESWKEIAAYLNRSERTVRRWEEKEGLPVHRLRHEKRGSVYAYAWELDEWRESRRQLMEAEPPDAPPAAPPVGTKPADVGQEIQRVRWWRWIAATAGVLSVLLGGFWLIDRRASPAARPPNPEAVHAVERARFGNNAGRVQIETGIRYYQEAIRLDPSYAPAWSGLAVAHIAQTWFAEVPATKTMTNAKREAQQALQLDASNSDAWRVLAFASHYLDWDQRTAETQFRKAIELGPQDRGALSWFGDFLTDMRRFEEARQYYRQAQDADPRWLEPITFAGNVHLFTGHPDLAIAEYRRALDIEPSYGLANHFLGRAYLASGQPREAVEQLRKSNELLGRVPISLGDLGYALGTTGQRSEAERMLADLMGRLGRGYYPAFPIAEIHLGLGNIDQAMDWLDRAADERHMGFYQPSADSVYDSIRSHPRFRLLMRRMNLDGG